jgi:peptidoglycan/xylan/chitin deacetylase (PgdA/CDA1 family)
MRLYRPWYLMRCLYPGAVFRIKTPQKVLFLTFDDGPDPVSTPAILGILERYKVKAVFFCNGSKAEKYPDLIHQIKQNGHTTGNHSYSHSDGWVTSLKKYIEDVSRADECTSANLFRPPYGHLTPGQFRALRKKYRIVFWDVMPYDFDKSFGSGNVLRILKKKIRRGSIIVLHDNPDTKAEVILGYFIASAVKEGYEFNILA